MSWPYPQAGFKNQGMGWGIRLARATRHAFLHGGPRRRELQLATSWGNPHDDFTTHISHLPQIFNSALRLSSSSFDESMITHWRMGLGSMDRGRTLRGTTPFALLDCCMVPDGSTGHWIPRRKEERERPCCCRRLTEGRNLAFQHQVRIRTAPAGPCIALALMVVAAILGSEHDIDTFFHFVGHARPLPVACGDC